MKDYRVTVKVRNNRIIKAIEDAGGKPGSKWCEDVGLSYVPVNDLINMTTSPLNAQGELRDVAIKLCDVLNKIPDDLWSNAQLYPLEKNFTELEMTEEQVVALLPQDKTQYIPDFDAFERTEVINKALDCLTEKQKEVMRLRFIEDMGLEDVARRVGVTRERIRQIEANALRKLRMPTNNALVALQNI